MFWIGSKLVQKFTNLLDTFTSYVGKAGQYLRVKAAEDGLEAASIVLTFLGLTDTPSSYSGATGKVPAVNAGETALEFASVYKPGGTDVAVVDGGTGASTAADARTNLGLGAIAVEGVPLAAAKGGTGATAAANAAGGVVVSNNLGILTFALQSKARAYLTTAAQVIANATNTKILLNAETYDVQNEFDPVTNYRFTALVAGYYQVNAGVLYASSVADKNMQVTIYKNGGNVFGNQFFAAGVAGANPVISDVVYLAINDYLELWTYQLTSGNANVVENGMYTFMSIHKLS